MEFLGTCEVCGKNNRNYRSLSAHLRHNKDENHLLLKKRWHAWRLRYRASLRCRKCGNLFSISNKADRNRKRCRSCEGLYKALGKKTYEKLSFDKPEDPRQFMTAYGSKAQWDGLKSRTVTWVPGDALYVRVTEAWLRQAPVKRLLLKEGISYKIYRDICGHAFGEDYDKDVLKRRQKVISVNREKARTQSGLELRFAQLLKEEGFCISATNVWSTLKIEGQKVKREVDIKLQVEQKRKLVVFCDGEAYHGPRCLYEEPLTRIKRDRQTALAFFDLGYSAVRYSESEIHNGDALRHIKEVVTRLSSVNKIYRNWCPSEELSL